jgi:hypothetical protein
MTLEKNAHMGARGNGIVSHDSTINTFIFRCTFCSAKYPPKISFKSLNLKVEKQNKTLFLVFICPHCGAELLQHSLKDFDSTVLTWEQKNRLITLLKNEVPN